VTEDQRPLLRVITPDATPEEIAALVAVLAAAATAAEPARSRRTEWNSPYRQVRPFYSHGPGGWRSSGLPKHRGRGT
jgi:Acyl-CoA carboxylase epsilon subunit